MTPRANRARQASPPGFDPSAGKGSLEIARELANGTGDGLANLAANAVSLDLLHVPAGLARLVGSAWHGGGGLSGLSAIFWEPGRAQVALAVDQAIDGDFRAAAASTVEAVGIGVATGVALGELGAAAVDAVPSVRNGSESGAGQAAGPRRATSAQVTVPRRPSEISIDSRPNVVLGVRPTPLPLGLATQRSAPGDIDDS